MEEPMRKTKKQKQPKSTDTLLKTSKKKDIELTEKELNKVSGGLGDIKGEQIERDHKDWVRAI
jgi:bacteriocin-like protein